ncbi:retrovirus-related pol polyprotein from transposon TNT 1-94 [Tanacetum coccineum]
MGTVSDVIAGGTEGAVQQDPVRARVLRDLSAKEKERYKADICATNILLQGETIHVYYVRFSKLINDMRNIKMTMSRMQLNSKFVNNMLPEWSRFIIEVKLNKGLKESNFDQLYAYLKQHKIQCEYKERPFAENNARRNMLKLGMLVVRNRDRQCESWIQSNFQRQDAAYENVMENGVVLDEESVVGFLQENHATQFDEMWRIWPQIKGMKIILKKDFKQKEDKFLEEFLDIKRLKEKVEDRLYKPDQSVQTVHMICKPKSFLMKRTGTRRLQNILMSHRASKVQPKLYNGHVLVMSNHARPVVHDSEDTRDMTEITRKRMIEKMQSPQCVENKIFWSIDNNDRKKAETSVPKPLSALTVYPPNTPVKLVPRVLPTKSQVKINLYVFKRTLVKEVKYWRNFDQMSDEIEDLKAQLEGNLKVATRSSVKTKVLAPAFSAIGRICYLALAKRFHEEIARLLLSLYLGKKQVTFTDKAVTSTNNTQKKECTRNSRLMSSFQCHVLYVKLTNRTPSTNWDPKSPNPPNSSVFNAEVYSHLLVSGSQDVQTRLGGKEMAPVRINSEPVPTATVVNAPIVSTNTSVSTMIAQDAPSISHSLSSSQVHPPVFPQGVAAGPTIEDTLITQADLHPSVNPVAGEPGSAQSTSGDVSLAEPNQVNQPPDHLRKWTKDHPLDNIVGNPSRPVSTRKQLASDALWCCYHTVLSKVEPKNFKMAVNEDSWFEAMQDEIHEFDRLKVWELVPRPDYVMVIGLKWIYKVKLDEYGDVLKNKAQLVAKGYRQEEGSFWQITSNCNPCNRVLERQKKLRNQIFRALTASVDVPSSVTKTTDTTSTLPPPPPPLQKPIGSFKDGDGDGDTQFQ